MRQFMQRPWTWSDWVQAWHALLPASLRGRATRPGAVSARWALDVALVVEGRRTATLFDATTLSWRDCLAWMAWLDKHRLPVLLVLFEPARHVFVVHTKALDTLWQHPPVFVDPAHPTQPRAAAPASAQAAMTLLQEAAHRSQRGVVLRSDTPHARLGGISLCGWLLGYPVVYAVSQEPLTFTSHAPDPGDPRRWEADAWYDGEGLPADAMSLFLVQVYVQATPLSGPATTHSHRMLSFSIPTACPNAMDLVQRWQCRLASTWDHGCAYLPFLAHATYEVCVTQVHQDHIVL